MLLVVLLVVLLDGVGSGVGSGVDGGQGGEPRCMQARGLRRVWAWLWADLGAEGGWGLWWCLCWGLGARVGGEGSDVVMEFVYSAPTASSTSARPRKATGSKAQADSCGVRSMRAASDSDSCHSQIRPDETWVPKSPRSAIPDVSFSHHVTQPPLRFSRGTTSANARRPTRRGSALDRSALSDFKATHQEILASINLQGKRRAISTSLVSENPRAKCAAVT